MSTQSDARRQEPVTRPWTLAKHVPYQHPNPSFEPNKSGRAARRLRRGSQCCPRLRRVTRPGAAEANRFAARSTPRRWAGDTACLSAMPSTAEGSYSSAATRSLRGVRSRKGAAGCGLRLEGCPQPWPPGAWPWRSTRRPWPRRARWGAWLPFGVPAGVPGGVRQRHIRAYVGGEQDEVSVRNTSGSSRSVTLTGSLSSNNGTAFSCPELRAAGSSSASARAAATSSTRSSPARPLDFAPTYSWAPGSCDLSRPAPTSWSRYSSPADGA
jgi:hypothetical protein